MFWCFLHGYHLFLFRSWSGYWDELAWAAAWLYKVTGEQQYLSDADGYMFNNGVINKPHEFSWDSKQAGAQVPSSNLNTFTFKETSLWKKWKTIRIIRLKSSWLLFWGYYHLMKILLSIFDRNSSMRKSTDKPILGIIIRSNKWCKIHQPN